jgi:mevalonate kinase
MNSIASAPGKLVLLGEHAVVYQRPCLVTAVDLRVYAGVERSGGSVIRIISSNSPGEHLFTVEELAKPVASFPQNVSFVLAAVARFYNAYGITEGVTVRTVGPQHSYGLGSSSAVTVAAVKALSDAFQIEMDPTALFKMAYAAVLDVQGTASGFDVASAVFGGTLYFVTGGKTITPLPIADLPLLIGYSRSKVGTVNLIHHVAHLHQTVPYAVEAIFDLVAKLVEDAREKMLAQKWAELGALLNINQGLLDSLGVNTLPLAKPILAAREAGAYGAKLSGAGGGDCMFALVDDEKRSSVRRAMEEAGAQIIDLPPGAPGVRCEEDF